MKKIVNRIFVMGALAFALVSCDQKNEPIENIAYIHEALSSGDQEIVLGDEGETTTSKVSIRIAQKADADTKVKLELSQAALDTYNRRNQTEFVVIPKEYVEFPTEVIIPEGSSSVDVDIKVTSFAGEPGVEYAAPVAITKVDGTDVSKGAGSFVITFGKILTQAAPGFISANAMSIPFPEEVELENLTLEWWARVVNQYGTGGFSINNQAMFSFNSDQQLYVRYGDVTYGTRYNFLQIKTLGIDANYDSGDPSKGFGLNWGEWYHWAHTFDAATGEIVLYKNGEEVNRMSGGTDKVFHIGGPERDGNGCTMCGAGSYHRDVIEMCQVRLWKTTRTAAQIAKNYKKEVKYNDPNLVFYFPMNEGEGSTLHDVTGNGHDVTIGDKGSQNTPKSWNVYSFE